MQATGIILAGGKSSRMGTNKALLLIDGKTVIERIVDEVKETVDELLIVTNSFEEYEFLNLPMVEDVWKGMGPLAGIHAGLNRSSHDKNLIVACDMPFVSGKLGALLLHELVDFQAVVPNIEGQLHPLFAAYHKNVSEKVEECIKENQLRIRAFLQQTHTKIVNEEELKNLGFRFRELDFFNMNHPEEYTKAINMNKNCSTESRE